jgi:hypothetical protein
MRNKMPRPVTCWGYYNFGRLLGVARTRKRAQLDASEWTGDPWPAASQYVQVRKVSVSPVIAENDHAR